MNSLQVNNVQVAALDNGTLDNFMALLRILGHNSLTVDLLPNGEATYILTSDLFTPYTVSLICSFSGLNVGDFYTTASSILGDFDDTLYSSLVGIERARKARLAKARKAVMAYGRAIRTGASKLNARKEYLQAYDVYNCLYR